MCVCCTKLFLHDKVYVESDLSGLNNPLDEILLSLLPVYDHGLSFLLSGHHHGLSFLLSGHLHVLPFLLLGYHYGHRSGNTTGHTLFRV